MYRKDNRLSSLFTSLQGINRQTQSLKGRKGRKNTSYGPMSQLKKVMLAQNAPYFTILQQIL